MAVNYAQKYSDKVDEKFTTESLTTASTNKDYDFIGVETVNVTSIPTVALNDYKTTGSNRYGNPEELGNEIQEMTMTQDRSFAFTIDRKSRDDSQMTMEAGKALQREISERIIPEVDTYRIAKMLANAPEEHIINLKITKENAYDTFLIANEKLDDAEVPSEGRICHATPEFIRLIKEDDNFTKRGDMATQIAIKGVVGEIDSVLIIKTPKKRMPGNCKFLITHPVATTAPVKLAEYNIHENPPGISGWLVEGRVRHDAFVLKNKKECISACVYEESNTPEETTKGENSNDSDGENNSGE